MHGASLRHRWALVTAATGSILAAAVAGALHARRPAASPLAGDTRRELDLDRAVAWVKRLLDDAEESGGMTPGITARDLANQLAAREPDFDPVAAGFPTRLLFVHYAVALTDYELRRDREWNDRVVPALRNGTGPR